VGTAKALSAGAATRLVNRPRRENPDKLVAFVMMSSPNTISAFPPKADITARDWNVRFVPKADIQKLLFDHRVDAQRICAAALTRP
jgi:hypothetical protein